jgi:hypothetical protein
MKFRSSGSGSVRTGGRTQERLDASLCQPPVDTIRPLVRPERSHVEVYLQLVAQTLRLAASRTFWTAGSGYAEKGEIKIWETRMWNNEAVIGQ